MSGVISFRTDDDVIDTVDRIAEQDDEDVSRALVTKRLVEEAVEARETPLWVRVGLSDRRAAQIEALRQEGETEEDLARELLTEALEDREEDVLDAIGASDELREAVEDAREEGEPIDDAVRRLLRNGVASTGEENQTSRSTAAVVILFLGGLPATLAAVGEPVTAFTTVAALVLWVLFGGMISSGMDYVRGRIGL